MLETIVNWPKVTMPAHFPAPFIPPGHLLRSSFANQLSDQEYNKIKLQQKGPFLPNPQNKDFQGWEVCSLLWSQCISTAAITAYS